jgi:thiomorpholine-carboxylate dehydrogenase
MSKGTALTGTLGELLLKFFAETDVRRLLHWQPLIDAMETALAEFSAGKVIQPVRNMITIEEGKRYLGVSFQ